MSKKLLFLLFLSVFVFLSGCIDVDVHQKLKRNGNMDLSITYSAPPAVIELLRDSVNLEGSEVFKFKENEDSLSFVFKDINKDLNIGMFEGDEGELEEELFNPENFDLVREFRFPYYYFTYSIDLSRGEGSREVQGGIDDALGDVMSVTYTVEVFGRIVDTNGELLSNKEARFDLVNPDEEFRVVFRDFFFFTWVGSLF